MISNQGMESGFRIDLAEYYRSVGKSLELQGFYLKAIEKYKRAIREGYGNSNFYFDLGKCYLALGREEKANHYFSRV